MKAKMQELYQQTNNCHYASLGISTDAGRYLRPAKLSTTSGDNKVVNTRGIDTRVLHRDSSDK